MGSIGKLFILVGFIFIIVGGIILLFNKVNIPLGRLPGDIAVERENFHFYFPITTMIIISVILSLILNVIKRLF